MSNDQINLEAFFGGLLEDFKAGMLSKEQAVGALVGFSAAINSDDFDEARRWAMQGRKLARDLVSVPQAALLLARPSGLDRH